MKIFLFALRLLWRDQRSGELALLLCALLIAVTSASAIGLFSDRLQRTMNLQAAEFLAADLVISSPQPIPQSWLDKAAQLGLSRAQTVEFPSVIINQENLLLAGIKAVSQAYPLRGQLKITDSDYHNETISQQGPELGSVWVEKRVLSSLNLKLGDSLTVGEKALKITRIITYEPDKQGDFFSFSPRAMINDADLAATGSIQAGSHVHYYFQFIGDSPALQTFNNWIKPQLSASQRLLDIQNDRPELGSALARAQRYIGLSSILVIVIAGVAIAMATRRYSERHLDNIALLRCLGCKQMEILQIYSYQFFVLGLIASGIGCFLGWLAQFGLFQLLAGLLPQRLADPSIPALLFGMVIGMAMLLGFALPPLLSLQHISPLRVLRRDTQSLSVNAWLVYGLSLSVIGVLIWQHTNDTKMTATLLIAGLLGLAVLALLVYGLLSLGQRLLPKLNLSWRLGLQGMLRNRRASVQQILAFSITLTAMLLSFSVRNDLIDNWQQQLPENAPNHFALNIFPEQLAEFQNSLQQQAIKNSRFYPVVRGRLVAINSIPVQKIVSKDSQGESATQRELSLTWSPELPEANKISSGNWWQDQRSNLVSVEEKLAKNLNIHLGDQLSFTIGSQQLFAEVASIRSLRWDTMTPNFYMIFSPGTLEQFPYTYLTSFYLSKQQKDQLNTLVKNFPNTTILEVDLILQQFKTILLQLTQAINYLLYFAIAAGFTVLFAAVLTTLDARIQEGALMRTMGANRRLLRTAHSIEFCSLGFIAGLLSVLLAQGITFGLYTQVMDMAFQPNYWLLLLVPIASAVIIGFVGSWGLRGVLDKAPLQVLREM